MFDVDKDNTMNTEVTTPEQYFFSRTKMRSQPDFKKLVSSAIDMEVLKDENKNFCVKCNQLKLTRQQIANMTGLRVETVIRAMRQMHEKGELTIERGKVYN